MQNFNASAGVHPRLYSSCFLALGTTGLALDTGARGLGLFLCPLLLLGRLELFESLLVRPVGVPLTDLQDQNTN